MFAATINKTIVNFGGIQLAGARIRDNDFEEPGNGPSLDDNYENGDEEGGSLKGLEVEELASAEPSPAGRRPGRAPYRPRAAEGRAGPAARRGIRRLKKACPFCEEGSKVIDYKRVDVLQRFITERGSIRSRRKVGTCAKHQRQLAVAIKRARLMALLPFTADHIRGA